MKYRSLIIGLFVITASGCSTFTAQRYSISADNNIALKSIQADGINVDTFRGPSEFDSICRAVGPIAPPDGVTFEEYIRKALTDELKIAGLYDSQAPKVTLSGSVDNLSFSSSRGITGGTWDIGLKVNSSNGKSIFVSEHYEFESGFVADTACKQTAEAYYPAVQNLIGKLVKSPSFQGLVTP